MRQRRTPVPLCLRVCAALAVSVALGACASQRAEAPDKAEKPITAADFANASISRVPPEPDPPPTISREQVTAGIGETTVSLETPKPQVASGASSGKAGAGAGEGSKDDDQVYVVDQMVGQVNGKPVYADEFFASMDARLRQEAARLPLKQWLNMVQEDVGRALWDQTRDQLLLSEFQTTLTPEQKVGVRAFIDDLRNQFQRNYGGSSEVANEKIMQEEGMTLRQKVQSQADQEFILAQLRTEIAQRVHVSFKDIKLYYQQNWDRFHPTPVAVFRVIRVPLSKSKTIDEVQTRLAAGEDPAAIAADVSEWATDDHNMHRMQITGEFQETTFWGDETLNTATQELEVGETTERIDLGKRAWWVYLESIDAPPSQSLYEAQLEIEQTIKGQRLRAEEQRYIMGLISKSSMTGLEEMIKRLVAYAAERYYVQRIYDEKDTKPGAD